MATSYGGTTPAPNVNKAGQSQPRPQSGGPTKNPGGPGAVPAVVGRETPTIAKGGATNNGGRGGPAVTKTGKNI